MIEVNILKCDSQCPKFIHVLAILIMSLRHDELYMITLRCLQESLSGLGVKALLHLLIAVRNSSSENDGHEVDVLFRIFSSTSILICWCWAELKNLWRACHKSLSSRQGHLLYLIALMTESFLFLTQFISFYSPLLLPIISKILSSKNSHLVFLTTLLNFSNSPNILRICTSLILSSTLCSTMILNI